MSNTYDEPYLSKKINDFDTFMATTLVYRDNQVEQMKMLIDEVQELVKKQGDLTKAIDKLPCGEGRVRYDFLEKSVSVLWVFVSAMVLSMLILWIKRGG